MNITPRCILDAQNPCSPLSIPTSKTALLLLDFHNFILSHHPNSGQDVVERAVKLRQWAKDQHQMLVLHCLIDLKASTIIHQKMATKVNGVRERLLSMVVNSSPAREVEVELFAAEHPLLKPTADEYVFYRPPGHVSALGSYGIREFFGQHGIESLMLAGFSTSACVINTAKEAADSGFVVTVVNDACGDRDELVHKVVMEKLLVGQCHVVTVAEIEQARASIIGGEESAEEKVNEQGLRNLKLEGSVRNGA